MAWHECINGNYVLCFRVGQKRFRRSLDKNSRAVADEDVQQVELNLLKLQRGYLKIPKGADVLSFLLSNGRVTETLASPVSASSSKYNQSFRRSSFRIALVAHIGVRQCESRFD
jgi:hypothetical protein